MPGHGPHYPPLTGLNRLNGSLGKDQRQTGEEGKRKWYEEDLSAQTWEMESPVTGNDFNEEERMGQITAKIK